MYTISSESTEVCLFMQKKKSNIKRMGVKSIHYSNNNVIVEDAMTQDPTVLYDVEYDHIDDLGTAKKIDGRSRGASVVSFDDIPGKRGFRLGKVIDKARVSAEVRSVKSVSYAQQFFGITTDNNFEIQIYQNYEDIKKLIANYCNHIIYSLNSMSKVDITESHTFDNIGTMPCKAFFENFDARNNHVDDLKVLLPAMSKVLSQYGVESSDKVRTKRTIASEIDCLQYIAKLRWSRIGEVRIDTSLESNVTNVLDRLYREHSRAFDVLCNTRAISISNELKNFPLSEYNFEKTHPKKIVNKWLSNQEVFKLVKLELAKEDSYTIVQTPETEVVYDYLRLLSIIRNFVVHNSVDMSNIGTLSLIDMAEQDLKKYAKGFSKNNAKYLNILHSMYKDKSVLKEFFYYSLFGNIKNLGISIEKIRKNIILSYGSGEDTVRDQDRSEYLNKYKTMLGYMIYRYYKANVDIDSIIMQLKETETDEHKEEVYARLADTFYTTNKAVISNMQATIKQYLGKKETEMLSIDVDIDISAYVSNKFINLLYVFTRFLNKKDANNFYAQIINKCESIRDLKTLASNMGVRLDSDTFANMRGVIPFDSDIGATITQLEVLRNLSVNSTKKTTDNIKQSISKGDYLSALYCFNLGTYNKDKLEKDITLNADGREATERQVKPLKQYLRNNIVVSKQFQYLRKYSDTSICGKIISNKSIVRFVISDMLGIDLDHCDKDICHLISKDKEGMYRYIAKVYHDYRKPSLASSSSDIDKEGVEYLIDQVHTFTFDKLVDNIFGRNKDHNYTVLVRLYLTICYTVIKGIMSQNSAYFVAMQDFDRYHAKLRLHHQDIDLKLVDDYIKNATNKKSRSYRQLIALLKQDYLGATYDDSGNLKTSDTKKDYVHSNEYNTLAREYRNKVEHCELLSRKHLSQKCNVWTDPIENVTSYFALYQILMQRLLKDNVISVWGNKAETYFKLNPNKSYSTKLTIAINMFLSYNMSRFNNITIEKYAIRK